MMNQFLEFMGNHPMLFAALAAVVVWMISSEIRRAMLGVKAISAKEAVQLINHAGAIMLDTRPAAEFQKGHIINAKNAALNELPASVEALDIDKESPIILYCAIGTRAANGGGILKKQGFTKLFYLKKGLQGWLGDNLPIEN